MKPAAKIFQFFWNSLIFVVVSLLVFVAVSLSLARVLLPFIDDYKADVEIWVSDMIGQQVEIATLDAAWYGMEPQLVLKGVQLLSDDRMETLGYFQQARLGLDILSSAIEGRIRPGAFTLNGARFVIVRHEDGAISLEGFNEPNASSNSDKNRLLEEWFFKQRLLDVKDSEIVWLDLQKSKKTWLFKDVNLRFRNDGQRHWVDGWVNLPNSLGDRLQVALDVRGDLLSADSWVGNVYLQGEKLNIPEVTRNFSLDNLNVSNGTMDFRLWTQWRKAKMHSAQGNINLSNVQMSAQDAPKIRVINNLSTNFSALKNISEWEATFDKIVVQSGRRLWPESRLDFKYNPESNHFISEIAYLDLGEVLPIVSFLSRKDQMLSQVISGLKAKGIVSRLKIAAQSVDEQVEYFAKGVISNFRNRPWKEFPGVSDLDGQFKISNHSASIVIPRQNVNLDYRQKFQYRHRVRSFKTSIFSTFNETGFRIVAKDTEFKFRRVNSSGSFQYQKLTNESPKLDLAFYFKGGRVSDVEHYVPSKIMPKSTTNWLENALQGGSVHHGGLLYFGALKDFPFKSDEGIFNVNLAVKNGKLKFSDDWPLITSINGIFDLQASKLSFHGSSGVTSKATLKNVEVRIPDYRRKDKTLLITGKAFGATSNKLSYLYSSPMGRGFSEKMRPLKLDGDSVLDLDLTIPLLTPEKVKIFGELLLEDNHLFADKWKLDVRDVSANLRFNNDGLWSDDFRGKIKQTDIEGGVKTVKDEDGMRLIINSASFVSHDEVTELLDFFIDKAYWGQYLNGETEIKTEVIIPVETSTQPLMFTLQSNMEGMTVDLPYPLRKSTEDKKELSLSTALTGKTRNLKIDYGNTHSIFEITATENTQQITRGGIGFQQSAKLPVEIGYRFSGTLTEFNWAEWGPLLIPGENEKALVEGGGSSGSIYFDVNVDKFSLFGYKFGSTLIQASHTSQLWSMHLSGKELEGQIIVPVVLSSSPMVVDMDRLHVMPGKSEDTAVELDPREMPEIKLKVADFKYKGIPFGMLEVDAKKITSGLRLDKLSMKTKETNISGQGDWVVTSKGQKSEFDILVNSQNIGKAIGDWGYANAIGGGKGNINLNVNWPGKPSDFDFNAANGDVSIKIKDASLLDFELGATKMFGLLLPRRLILDFRDVFKKGMHFDEIKGEYQIQSGDAFTTGLYLNGPVIDIHMAGRIGLSKRDYDQVVTVNRRILGDSLPVLAALTAAAPLVAAQVFIFKKMFEKQIDDILSVQYTIGGTWEKPLITPVLKNAATGEDLTEDILGE